MFLQFILEQFEHMTQLLRHFYSFFLSSSSWGDQNTIAKMKKILNLLQDKLNGIASYRNELKSRTSAGAGIFVATFDYFYV